MDRPCRSNSRARAKTESAPSPLMTDIREAIDLMQLSASFRLNSCLRQSQSLVHSAIHKDSLPGYVRRAFRREPNNGFGNFAGLAQPLQRGVGSPAGENLFFFFAQSRGTRLGQFFQAIGGGESGSDVVDQNSVFADLVGQALYKSPHGSTNRIGEHQVGDGLFGGNGGNRDDASPALTLHVRDNFAC